MPNVLILPHYHYENEFANFLNEVNVTQADFKFYLLPPENTIESPITKPMADYCEILDYLNNQKKRKMPRVPTSFCLNIFTGTLL